MAAPKTKSILTYILFVAIGGFLFYLAFRETEWTKLWSDFRAAKWYYLILSGALGYYAYIARGMRWNMLLRSMDFPIRANWSAIHGIALGYFSNLLVPRSGELFRCTAMYRAEKIPVDRLVGTVILERIIDLFMLALVFGLAFITNFEQMLRLLSRHSSVDEVNLSGFPWWLVIIAISGLLASWVLFRIFRNNPIFAKVRQFGVGVFEGLKSFRKLNRNERWHFISYTFQVWIMYFLMVYVVFFALDSTSHLGVASGLFIMVVGGLGMVIPSPGGIGSYHFLVMTGFVFLGVDQADGLSFATIVHTTQLVMTILGGLIGFLYLARVRAKQKHQNG